MKILFLSSLYPSKEYPLNGNFIKEHASAIKNAGEEVVVLALNVSYWENVFRKRIEKFTDEYGIETHIIHIQSRFYKWIYINPFFLYSVLQKYFHETIYPSFNPDIIHSNILYPCAIIGDKLSVKYNKTHIITEHWSKVDKYMGTNLLSFQGRRSYRNAKFITVVSKFLKNNISKYLPDSSKIKIIPNVVDINIFSFSPKKSDNDKVIFSCIAKWNHPKQPMLFVNALEQISKIISKKIELHFVGDGSQLIEIKKLNLSYKIHFYGDIPKLHVAEILHKSDFFLHASLIETFSIVVAEALSTGTPVIASNVGALPELVNEANGILVENTVQEWEKAINSAMKISFNHLAISEAGKNKFSKESIGKQFSELYKSI